MHVAIGSDHAGLELRDARRVATCLEFGPRFLHPTGQAYKGGRNTGVFLQVACDDAVERGDFQVPVENGRRPPMTTQRGGPR